MARRWQPDVFLPWLERFGWSARLDLVMLDLLLKQMASHTAPMALSLSGASLRDPQVLAQLLARLRQYPQLAGRLTLELDEDQLPEQGVLESLTQQLRELGFDLALQHFGGRFSMIGNLARLGLAYLKVDGSYLRAIDEENDKRLFIEAMQRAANSIDLPLIGEARGNRRRMAGTQGSGDQRRAGPTVRRTGTLAVRRVAAGGIR